MSASDRMVKHSGGFDMGPIPEGWERQTDGELQDDDMCWDIYSQKFLAIKDSHPYPGEGYGSVADYHLLIRKCST